MKNFVTTRSFPFNIIQNKISIDGIEDNTPIESSFIVISEITLNLGGGDEETNQDKINTIGKGNFYYQI